MKHAAALYTLLLMPGASTAVASAGEQYRLDPETYQTAINMAAGHPNERARWHGLWAYSNGRHAEARKYFERAAYYGDKPAQYLLSVMHHGGEGAPRDPVMAYIWADLAAERGTSEPLLAIRERLWEGLSEEQRARVREIGPDLYERYGDAAAMDRTNREIARFSRSRTGSRAGSDAAPMAMSFGGGRPPKNMYCPETGNSPDNAMDPRDFYAAGRTDLDDYWREQDVALRTIVNGKVRVGGLERARDLR